MSIYIYGRSSKAPLEFATNAVGCLPMELELVRGASGFVCGKYILIHTINEIIARVKSREQH